MKKILLFGAGKSTTVLIDYLLKYSEQENWKLIVVDADLRLAKSKTANHPNARAFSFDINIDHERKALIDEADVVISMLPPVHHLLVAKDCIACKKHLLTASYIDSEMERLRKDVEKNELIFLCEMGLDPGIDHMSAMHLFDTIREEGGTITGFKSHCGGLVAPESDTNPWHYKISWNPINVVNAGKMGAVYKTKGELIEVDYYEVFEDNETIWVPGVGEYAWYPNRNSLAYMPIYHLQEADTFLRTTLRHPNYCKGWHCVVLAGLTDNADEATIKNFKGRSFSSWFHACLNFYTKSENLTDFLRRYVAKEDHELIKNLFEYLGLMSQEVIPEHAKTSEDILKYLLETRLVLSPNDKDMVLMLHEVEYSKHGRQQSLKSTLVVKGDDNLHTAMAKTVGLPLAVAAKLILNGHIATKGLHIPTSKEIYTPVLAELAKNGIFFSTTES